MTEGRVKTAIGFTLIELLVVVTIIVVLLALLTPAIDKALYQADLAACGASQNAIIKGLSTYAMSYHRSYPLRPTAADGNALPYQLKAGSYAGTPSNGADDRVALGEFVSLKLLVDPLCHPVRLDAASNAPDSWAYASYALWHGWAFAGQSGMRRLGDQFAW